VLDDDVSFSNILCQVEGADPLRINLLGRSVPQNKENTL
jgi:hypothetical protein